MKMTCRNLAVVLLMAVSLLVSDWITPIQVRSQEFIPDGITPLSRRTAVLSFPLSVFPFVRANQGNFVPSRRFQELESVTIAIEDRTEGRDTLSISEDFLPLTASALSSGIALFKESGAQPGGFNFQIGDQNSDTPLDLFNAPTVTQDPANPRRFFITFTPVPGSAKLSIFQDQFPDFYIVAQTSLNILHGDRFEVSIPANGIKIRDLTSPLPDDTLFDTRFPGPEFGSLNPDFARPSIFEGDLFELFSFVDESDNTTRIDASSQPTTVLSLDFVGRQDQGYFLKELRVNWIGLNLGQIARLMANRSQSAYSGATTAGVLAAAQAGILQQVNDFPSFFYSPWFYNFPINPETGEILTTVVETADGPLEFPMTAALDPAGFPLSSFILGLDDLNAHVTSYVPSGPRLPNIGIDALTPSTISQDVLLPLSSSGAGGIFLYRELGGTVGNFDRGVDQIINLDPNNFRVEPFPITPEEVQSATSPIRQLLKRLIPGVINEGTDLDTVTFLFEDSNLAADLMGVAEVPDAVEGFRPPYGTLACYEDPDCLFFDLMANVLRPFLGLTEGQIRYLAEFTEENGITNMEELFGFPIVQGFSFVLPIAQNNAISNISAPSSKVGDNAGPDIFIAIQTSDNLRALDSFVPFIRPQDIVVGTNVGDFTQGNNETVDLFDSVSSIGVGRRGSGTTFAMIGRPKPRFQFEDLTQPGPTPLEANRNNILFDSSMSSPPKAVIGINAIDFGQFPNRVQNSAAIASDNFDVFFDESSVLGEFQVEFLPTPASPVFDPIIFNTIPTQLFVDLPFSRIITQHGVALYVEDDTPLGNGFDDDGDGLVDEEAFNLIDDDGDGLIDEDLGDGTPAGTNNVFDSFDRFYPLSFDRWGAPAGFQQSTFVFPPNDQTKFQDYINAIQPPNAPFNIQQGGMLPLDVGEGSWFTELDMRVLNFDDYQFPRTQIFPSPGMRIGITPSAGPEFDPPLLNQGTFTQLQPYTGLMDLFKAAGLPDIIPTDDIIVTHPGTGEELFLLLLTSDDGQIPILEDPDGDPRRTIILSLAAALRFPNPTQGFVRVGSTPMVVDVGGPNGSNPSGDNLVGGSFFQNGFFVETADQQAIQTFLQDMLETLADSIENAVDLKADFEEEIADIEDDAASQDPPEQPDFSDLELPEPVEISFPDPFETFGISDFLDNNDGTFQTNYQYQIQIPDENFGSLAGNDFYLVLRAGDEAETGDSFRMRIRSGQLNRQFTFTDPADNTQTTVDAPRGGVGFQSFIKTDMDVGLTAFPNVSKNQITTGPIVVRSSNVPPQIQFISPGSGQNIASEDFTFDITFQATDVDNVATVRLFVDRDNKDFDGTFIPGAQLREGFDTSFTINLREDIPDFDPTLQYFIYAEVTDGVNAPVLVYADGPILALPSTDNPTGGDEGTNTNVVPPNGNVDNFIDYVKLTNDGRLFTLGDQPGLGDVTVVTRSTDMEKTANNAGAVVVQDNGAVFGTGTVGAFQRRLQPNGTISFEENERAFFRNAVSGGELITSPTPGQISIDFARDIEVDFANGAIYILDGEGDMLYLGNANTNLRPPAVDIDLYRDMELSPDGSTLFFLTGNGMFSTSGSIAIGEWNDLIAEDKYRDLELVVDGDSVSGILVVDDDGKVEVIGSSSRAGTLAQLANELEPPAGSIRQIKTFPNNPNTLILVEGSGQITVASDVEVSLPRDGFIFAENPGIDNDRIVDIETSNINLQTVVDISREVLRALSNEDVQGVMKHVSPNYRDRNGNNAAGLQQSLTSLFNFFQVESYAVSSAQPNSFTLSTSGDRVRADILVDFVAFVPDMEFFEPDIEADAETPETVGMFLFNELPFDQTIRIREVSDGRAWTIELWEIREFGRDLENLITQDDVEFEDITFLTRQTANKRIGFFQPRSKFLDPPMNIFINKDERNPLSPVGLLAIFRENAVRRDLPPPILELTVFFGTSVFASPLGNIEMQFQPNETGVPQLTSMFLSQFISENTDAEINLGDTAEPEPPISSLDGQTANNPMGFSFRDRGPVTAIFPGEADVILQGGELLVTNPLGGIMMLPQNTDIFAINPTQFIRQFSRSTVRINPFDPNSGQTQFPGFSATAEEGRAYLVINRDGRTFGLIQLPPADLSDLDDGTQFILDYRFEESFVLPPSF